jgi:D-amino-acid dehydrogenase
MFPPLRADAAAVYIGGAARVDGRKLAAALARAAVRQGAVIRDGEAHLASGRGRVAGVRVDGALIEGDAVVAATGAWTRSFLQATGLAVPVEPQRGQIMHISLGEVDTSRWPVLLPGASGHYMLAFDGGRIVAGATRETGSGFDYRITPAGLAEILEQALAVAPGLAAGTYLETRVGLRPMGPGIRPLLGPVPGLDGLVVATGLGASGLTMGPLAGSLAAQAALGLPPAIDLEPFAPLPALCQGRRSEPGDQRGGEPLPPVAAVRQSA